MMDAQTCLKKLEYVGVLNFATVDRYGKPQIRNSSPCTFLQRGARPFAKNCCQTEMYRYWDIPNTKR